MKYSLSMIALLASPAVAQETTPDFRIWIGSECVEVFNGGAGMVYTPEERCHIAPPSAPSIIDNVWTTPTPEVSRNPTGTPEYNKNWFAMEVVGAGWAHDQGWTGKGVTVGVIDDGIDVSSVEFSDKFDVWSEDFGGSNNSSNWKEAINNTNDSHGTKVTSILAGAANASGTMGVAPEASILFMRVDSISSSGKQTFPYETHVSALRWAADRGLKIVNRSYSTSGYFYNLAAAVTNYGKTGGLLINSAGNNGGSEPVDGKLVNASNRDAWLFVGSLAIDYDEYKLTDYSNRAGSFKDRYIVAVGDVNITMGDGTVKLVKGTSFSTPTVTGAAALILQKWPHLTGQQVGDILLTTAKDIGEKGPDEIFGMGLLDIKAALSPIDPKIVVNGKEKAITTTVISSITGISISESLSDITITDKFTREFQVDLSKSVHKTHRQRRLRDLFAPTVYTYGDKTARIGYDSTAAQFVTEALTVGYSIKDFLVEIVPGSGMSLGYSSELSEIKVSVLTDDSIFGAPGDGLVSLGTGATHYTVNGKQKFPLTSDVSLTINGTIGISTIHESKRSLISDVSSIITSSWSFIADTGVVRLGIAQPLVIERGSAKLSLPSGDRKVDISSNSRPLKMVGGLTYSKNNINLSADFEHNITGYNDTTAYARLTWRF